MSEEMSRLEAIATNAQPTGNAKVIININLDELSDDPDIVIDSLLDHLPVGESGVCFTSASDYAIMVSHRKADNTILVRWADTEEIQEDSEGWTFEEALEFTHPSRA